MLANFVAGGAAINALCNQYNIHFQALDTGIDHPTADISLKKAISDQELAEAFSLGWN